MKRKAILNLIRASEVVTAAGTTAGAQTGHGARASAAADKASEEAHEASAAAHSPMGGDKEHAEASALHEKASQAHAKAMVAHGKASNQDKAAEHAKAMCAHDTACEAHGGTEPDADAVEAAEKVVGEMLGIKAVVKKEPLEVIHCRASGSNLSAAKPWAQGSPVEFMYMPAGLHTINAGFRNGGINLTVEVDPQRDAEVCQASLDSLIQETPKQKAFGCFEHEEKQASVWANKFKAGNDGVMLEAEPSEAGAKAVNGKNHRSWSPSFTTNAEYAKCQCRKCDKGIRACKCDGPSYFFPDGVKGSASVPANITGVDFCVGTLTNKPAFRAIAPVQAKEKKEVVQAGGPGSGRHGNLTVADVKKAHTASMGAAKLSQTAWNKSAAVADDAKPQDHASAAIAHQAASAAHLKATQVPGTDEKYHQGMMQQHDSQARAHIEGKHFPGDNSAAAANATRATDQEESLDTILSRFKPDESIDAILARIPGSVGGYMKDLDDADEIIQRMIKAQENSDKDRPDMSETMPDTTCPKCCCQFHFGSQDKTTETACECPSCGTEITQQVAQGLTEARVALIKQFTPVGVEGSPRASAIAGTCSAEKQ